ADARHEGSVGDTDGTRAAGAEEVELVIADEMSALPVAVYAKTKTRVLWTEAEFGKFGGGGVVKGNAAEIAAERPAGILIFPTGGKVHEADRHDGGFADLELERGTGGITVRLGQRRG